MAQRKQIMYYDEEEDDWTALHLKAWPGPSQDLPLDFKKPGRHQRGRNTSLCTCGHIRRDHPTNTWDIKDGRGKITKHRARVNCTQLGDDVFKGVQLGKPCPCTWFMEAYDQTLPTRDTNATEYRPPRVTLEERLETERKEQEEQALQNKPDPTPKRPKYYDRITW